MLHRTDIHYFLRRLWHKLARRTAGRGAIGAPVVGGRAADDPAFGPVLPLCARLRVVGEPAHRRRARLNGRSKRILGAALQKAGLKIRNRVDARTGKRKQRPVGVYADRNSAFRYAGRRQRGRNRLYDFRAGRVRRAGRRAVFPNRAVRLQASESRLGGL